jgi:hypothetical protein
LAIILIVGFMLVAVLATCVGLAFIATNARTSIPLSSPTVARIIASAGNAVDSRMTETASVISGSTPVKPSQTQTPSLRATRISSTPTVTPLVAANLTVTPIPCKNDSDFVSDVTIPDNTRLNAGTTFTKTWRIENSGTCVWNESYQFVFLKGDQMNGPTSIALSDPVEPGEQLDISIPLQAPNAPGTHQGSWQLQDSRGVNFGTKPYVRIISRSRKGLGHGKLGS